jgi:hypothetical protein
MNKEEWQSLGTRLDETAEKHLKTCVRSISRKKAVSFSE